MRRCQGRFLSDCSPERQVRNTCERRQRGRTVRERRISACNQFFLTGEWRRWKGALRQCNEGHCQNSVTIGVGVVLVPAGVSDFFSFSPAACVPCCVCSKKRNCHGVSIPEFDGKVRNSGPRTFCLRPQIRFPPGPC